MTYAVLARWMEAQRIASLSPRQLAAILIRNGMAIRKAAKIPLPETDALRKAKTLLGRVSLLPMKKSHSEAVLQGPRRMK